MLLCYYAMELTNSPSNMYILLARLQYTIFVCPLAGNHYLGSASALALGVFA